MDRDTGGTAVTSVTQVAMGKGPARGSMLVGKYRVESILGFGGMGLVLKAHNVDLGLDVAIKILREDVQVAEDNIARFVREAKNAVRLKSEHVARIRDVGNLEDGRPYMVMELLEGVDLGKLLLDHGTIEPRRAADLILQACDAIAEAHALGIVHRDIKPTNLFVSRRPDGSDLIKVLDFGISKAVQGGTEMVLTQTQSMLGTPAYMSPEQMRSARTVDRRSDIWSLGCVLYETVEGHPPFEASNFAELCVMVATEDPAPLQIAPELGGVLMRCLAKSIEERYQSIADMAEDLALLTSDPITAEQQLARIRRLEHPGSRDSTPIPITSELAAPRLTAGMPYAAMPAVSSSQFPTAPAINELRKPVSLSRTIGLLVLLFAVGIGAGLYVTREGDSSDSQAGVPDAPLAEEPPAATPIDATQYRTPVDATERAAVDATERASADANAVTVQPPPQKPAQPAKRAPPKNPVQPPKKPASQQPANAGSAAGVKSPSKKCDPFENPNGCKN